MPHLTMPKPYAWLSDKTSLLNETIWPILNKKATTVMLECQRYVFVASVCQGTVSKQENMTLAALYLFYGGLTMVG